MEKLAELGSRIDSACYRVASGLTNAKTPVRSGKRIDNWFVVTDSNVVSILAPLFSDSEILSTSKRYVVPAGEANKSLESATAIWEWLSESGATRNSGIINVGGGMITDLGGFAAACFKRGVTFINVPTTLLGAVDASVGGKTGVNLNTLKNEVGAFARPTEVVISSAPLATLSQRELLSGYAEMIKTGLIANRDLWHRMLHPYDVLENPELLADLMQACVNFKREITDLDACEHDLRRILNFGHTAGHAFESLSHRRRAPLTHGEAVAQGIVTALVLSHLKLQMPAETLHAYIDSVYKPCYKPMAFGCKDYPELLEQMAHDKKNNQPGRFSFVLLRRPGEVVCGCEMTADDVKSALDLTRDLLGI